MTTGVGWRENMCMIEDHNSYKGEGLRMLVEKLSQLVPLKLVPVKFAV